MSRGPPKGYVDPYFPDPHYPQDAPIVIYGYVPSLAVGLLGVTLYGISSILHIYQLYRYRTFYFIPVIVCTVLEVVGYVFRILSNRVDPYNVIYFVLQFFMIVVAPVFFSAAIYTVPTFIIKNVGREYSPVRPRVFLILFIVCDVVATVVQITGAASIGKAEANRQNPMTASYVLTAGLAFQVFSFLMFIALLGTLLYRMRKVTGPQVRPFSVALVVATLLVYLRTCFRLAETAQGVQKSLFTHEVFFGCLEFAPIVVAVFIFNVYHPGKWVPRYGAALE